MKNHIRFPSSLVWPRGFTTGLHAQLATAFVCQEKKMPEHWCTYSAESKSQFLIKGQMTSFFEYKLPLPSDSSIAKESFRKVWGPCSSPNFQDLLLSLGPGLANGTKIDRVLVS